MQLLGAQVKSFHGMKKRAAKKIWEVNLGLSFAKVTPLRPQKQNFYLAYGVKTRNICEREKNLLGGMVEMWYSEVNKNLL